MAKEYQFNWKPTVHPLLLQGTHFDKFEDVTTVSAAAATDSSLVELHAFCRVDDCGLFLYWQIAGKDTAVLDLSTVWEVRTGTLPRESRVVVEVEKQERLGVAAGATPTISNAREALEERVVWLTHGSDLVSVNHIYLLTTDVEAAKIWRSGLNEILRSSRIKHVCPTTSLFKYWRWLCLSTNERRKIPIRTIIRLFASGKPERMVQKCLCDLGLGGDKYIHVPRRMNKSLSRKLRNMARCGGGRRKRKEREELDVDLVTFDKFLRLYHKICPRTDVQELFVRLSGQKEYLTRERLVTFLNEEQRDPRLNEILFPFFDNARVQQLIAKYEVDDKYIQDGKMSGDAFLRFLMSDENAPVFLDRIELHQDMDQPLCHYYINSSHNTYLTGRQYGGKSSSEIYRTVLLSGCRCIELDCWDGTGENKGEPIITHGKAMCTDVFFKDVLYQIRDTAFARSDFPVILSFENHCCKSNQLKMAKYCMEIFGDMLQSKPIDDFPLESGVPLPSPTRLRRKILIKNKRLKADIEKLQLEQFLREGRLLDEEEEPAETPEVLATDDTASPPGDQRAHPESDLQPSSSSATIGSIMTPSHANKIGCEKEMDEAHPELKQSNFIQKLKPLGFTKKQSYDVATLDAPERGAEGQRSFKRRIIGGGSGDAEETIIEGGTQAVPRSVSTRGRKKAVLTKEEEERIFAEYHYTGATTNIHPLLSSLVNYTHPVKFSGFDVADVNNLTFHMSSFSESTGLGYLKQSAPEFVNYNKRQLSRIYPKGARVDSSNFLPQIFWNAGCQMVSLNFQTPDVYMQLNQGKFEYNGNSGYLLKPDFMRRPDRSFDPFSESPVDGVIAAHCSVRVVSGQFVCERKVGTYVEVEMYGLPTDTIRKEHRTRTVPANGLNPVYNEDPFVFRKVVLPELAVIRFAVYDESGKQLGQRILPLDGLQAGFRHIGLRTETSQSLPLATLFVQIVLKTYVPDELTGLVDALADPRAYLSAVQKRQEALHNMGVEDSDIVEVPAGGKNNSGKNKSLQKANGSAGNLLAENQNSTPRNAEVPSTSRQAADAPPVDKFKVDAISVEELRKDKSFVKLLKKLQKDAEELKRKHQKQRESTQKQQQTNVDKFLSGNQRSQKKKGGIATRHESLSGRESDPVKENAQRMRSLVVNQTDEWSGLVRRHDQEEYDQKKAHIKEEYDLLKKLMSDAHKSQMAALKSRLEAETKDLKMTQTKKNMEDTKAINLDKGIKTKAERDRRVKELNEKNLKMFVEERRRLAMKAQKHEEQLSKRHLDQMEALEKEEQRALEQEEGQYREELLASSRPESVV